MIGLTASGLVATGRRPVRVVIGSVVVLVGVMLGAGCGTRQAVVDAAAQPIVDRMRAAPDVRRWTFTYQPSSGSPHVACLTGIDEIEGSVDLDSGAIELTPNRDAPPIVITANSILVAANTGDGQPWNEISLLDDLGRDRLDEVFGPTLAGFIANGTREPHPTTTALAAVDVAASVRRDTSSVERTDTIHITVDADDYRQALASEGQQQTPTEPTPQLLVTVDAEGQVTVLEVTTDTAGPATEAGEHSAGYRIVASADETGSVSIPARTERVAMSIDDLSYPPPGTGCSFQS